MSVPSAPSPRALSHLELVQAAVLAPTPDNNQPWRFQSQENELLVYLVPEHSLPSDVHAMSDLTGLGAAIENACIAARQIGYEPHVDYVAPPAILTHEDAQKPVAKLSFTPGGTPDPLLPYLEKRCTCRRLYSRRPVAEDCLKSLSDAAKHFSEIQVDWITDRPRIRAFARLISVTDLVRFQYEPFHNEVFRQLRFSAEEVERTRDGMDFRTLELPPGTGLVLRLLRPWSRMQWVHRLGLGRLLTLPSMMSVWKSGALGVLTVPEPTARLFLRGGQAFQRIWLAASWQGLSLQPLGSPGVFFAQVQQLEGRKLSHRHQHTIRKAIARFAELVPETQARTVQIAFRLGHSSPPRFRSLRRAASDVFEPHDRTTARSRGTQEPA